MSPSAPYQFGTRISSLQLVSHSHYMSEVEIIETDVFIAGSGPIGCTFAREILDNTRSVRVWMAEMGAQENPVIGAHLKNSIKYQKDVDSFVHIIKGALQPVSVPPPGHLPTLGRIGWAPRPGERSRLVTASHNPRQDPERNLPACAITRAVGGMATHWTCACPEPHEDERKNCPIPEELPGLLAKAKDILGVRLDQFDCSIRHNLVKSTLEKAYPGRVQTLPLAVKRNEDNPEFVTWSGANTVLGQHVSNPNFSLNPEHMVVKLEFGDSVPESRTIDHVVVRDLKKHKEKWIKARKYVIACGAICTPQILWNSHVRPRALGHYLSEHSIAFCQIVLKRELIEQIPTMYPTHEGLNKHKAKYCEAQGDLIPIPHNDPDPQVTMPYSPEKPWHTQIHRDAFSYGDIGTKVDPRLIVDLRFFGKHDLQERNCVTFDDCFTDIYGMPQPTFDVEWSEEDARRDHEMMSDMCQVANQLGAFLPGSEPRFMPPGLALHITGTTRIGNDPETSVANEYSQVHEISDLYVGGNNVIPDLTACNPTLTSMAYAIYAARHLYSELK